MPPSRSGVDGISATCRGVTISLLPGGLFGTHLAALLFFLNPQVPFTALGVGRSMLLYSGLLGALGGILQLPWLWRRPHRAARWLPWTLTLALFLGAILDAAHASFYAYFLPPGINVRLLKTALWLALGGLISFYTALLHTLNDRRYGWRSRWALFLAAALSIFVAVERREAFRTPFEASARPPAIEHSAGLRLWVIGLDSATLDAILPLAGQGRLPNLSTLLREGAYGRLETFGPNRRSALWTTLATGKYPWKSGVTGEIDHSGGLAIPGAELNLLPRGLGFRLWGLLGPDPTPGEPRRRALGLWEIFGRLGLPSTSLSWPATGLQAKGGGAVISEAFFRSDAASAEAYPAELGALADSLRVRVADLDQETLAMLGPRPPDSVVAAFASDLWREALTFSLTGEDTSSGSTQHLFLALPGLASVSSRYFGGFYAAQFGGAANRRAQDAARRVAAYYEHIDRFLGQLLVARDGAMVAIVSAHGAAPIGWRERLKGAGALGGTFEGAPDGVIILAGPGIRPGALLSGPRLVDVAPTLLYALGLPVARDLDGRVLTGAFDASFLARRPLSFFPSYEAIPPRGDR